MKEIAQILDLVVGGLGYRRRSRFSDRCKNPRLVVPPARRAVAATKQGQRVGAISGGCLEDDVVKKAWWLTEKGPVIRRYDTTPDNEISTSGYGLGCNGIVHVMMERLRPRDAKILDLIRQVRASRQPSQVAHILKPDSDAGKHIYEPSKFETPEPKFSSKPSSPQFACSFSAPGTMPIPLTEAAKFLGWEVFVFDGRLTMRAARSFLKPTKSPCASPVPPCRRLTRGRSLSLCRTATARIWKPCANWPPCRCPIWAF